MPFGKASIRSSMWWKISERALPMTNKPTLSSLWEIFTIIWEVMNAFPKDMKVDHGCTVCRQHKLWLALRLRLQQSLDDVPATFPLQINGKTLISLHCASPEIDHSLCSDWDGWCHGDYVPFRFQMSHWKRLSGDHVPLLSWNLKAGNDSLHIESSHVPFKFSRRRQCRIHIKIHPDHCLWKWLSLLLTNFQSEPLLES